jgi:subtilisin family serine protease
VNVSVVGPANAVVERLGAQAAARGTVFVAAAGNEGPRAAPLYPAAYGWSVAVTAVDATGRPWPRAAAGAHIAFAAHGVEVPLPGAAAAAPRRWSGTSFAAPLVSAALAGAPDSGPARIAHLAALARDAGAPGRDPVYGWGLVEPRPCTPLSGSGRSADR